MLNELFQTYKKIIILSMILLSVTVFWFFGCHRTGTVEENVEKWEKTEFENGGYGYSFETENLKGNVVFGIKGYTVKDKNIPVEVNLLSEKEEFSGYIKISIPGDSSGGIAYKSAIQCNENEETNSFITVPQLGNASYFCFEILDQYENSLLSQIEIPAYSEWNNDSDSTESIDSQICIGILSDSYSNLEFMDELDLETEDGTTRLRTISLDEESFPENLSSLEMLSAVFVDDFSVETLGDKQKNILLSWVKNGGNLILATGASGEKVLSGLEKELKTQAGSVETERLYFDEKTDFKGEVSLYINNLTFEENAGWRRIQWSSPASFYQKNYGSGLIQLLRFSFTDRSLLQWNRLNDMTKSLLQELLGSMLQSDVDQENGLWNMEMALNNLNTTQMPNAFYYGVLFIIYIGTITVSGYFILRRIKRREYIWFVIPIISLVFTGGVILRLRGTFSNIQSSLSAIRVVDDQKDSNAFYLLYQNAEGEGKTLNMISSIEQIRPLDYNYGQETVENTSIRRVKEDYSIGHTKNGYAVIFQETTPGTIRMLEMQENNSVNYGEKTTVFRADVTGKYTSFSGTIQNDSEKNFHTVLAIRGNQYWIGEELSAGESVEIKDEDVKCWGQSEMEEGLSDQLEDSLVSEDIMNYIEYNYLKNNEESGDLILIGINYDDNFQLLRDGEKIGNQIAVYINHTGIEEIEKTECTPNINLEFIKDNLTYKELQNNLIEKEKIKVEYQFDYNKIVWAMARNRDNYTGKIYAYNYDEERMEEILETPDQVMQCEDLEPYLTEMNVMTILYENSETEETEYGEVPVISVWLKKTVRKG